MNESKSYATLVGWLLLPFMVAAVIGLVFLSQIDSGKRGWRDATPEQTAQTQSDLGVADVFPTPPGLSPAPLPIKWRGE